MGGEIGVTSELGLGSCFWFEVAVGSTADGDSTKRHDPTIAGSHVLVVDESRVEGRIFAEYLEDWGAEYTVVSEIEQGMTALRGVAKHSKGYDLFLLAVNSPGDVADRLPEKAAQAGLLSNNPCLELSFDPDERPELGPDSLACLRLGKPARWSHVQEALRQLFEGDKDAAVMRADQGSNQTDGSSFTAHVLLAEDNPVNQEVASFMLQDLGCTLTVVNTGRAAVEAAATAEFDLVLMDIQMPEMDGAEATRIIRARERGSSRNVPIVALTAHAMTHEREKLIALGLDDVLTKPYTREQLRHTLSRWLGQSH